MALKATPILLQSSGRIKIGETERSDLMNTAKKISTGE